MHPVLFELPFGGTANAYGTLILLGGLVAFPGTWWDAKQRNVVPGQTASFVVDFWLVIVFGAALGGRLAHILTVPGAYFKDPARVFALDNSGFVFFGSLLAIGTGWALLARRYNIKLATVCDLGATWMALGHTFGRLGCAMAGCCWGAPRPSGAGLQFPPHSVVYSVAGAPTIEDHTVGLHAAQLYEATGLALIFAVLVALRVQRGIEPPWRQVARYALAYGLLRACTEVFRGDMSRGFIVELPFPALAGWLDLPPSHPVALSISQAVAVALAGIGGLALRRLRKT